MSRNTSLCRLSHGSLVQTILVVFWIHVVLCRRVSVAEQERRPYRPAGRSWTEMRCGRGLELTGNRLRIKIWAVSAGHSSSRGEEKESKNITQLPTTTSGSKD